VKPFLLILRRDLSRNLSGGNWLLPIIFFLLVAVLFPFAIGPDPVLLARVGGGVLWAASLLAALLPIDRLISPDHENGVLDQYAVRGISEEIVALAKISAHWLSFGPPLMLAALPGSALLNIAPEALLRLECGLALGTLAFAALAVTVSAIVTGLKTANALAGLLMLPLAVPLLIFGAGMADDLQRGAFALLGATSLIMIALAPFAAGAAIRAARD
jgi:heme exporter protein B